MLGGVIRGYSELVVLRGWGGRGRWGALENGDLSWWRREEVMRLEGGGWRVERVMEVELVELVVCFGGLGVDLVGSVVF